jgi:ABC-type sugar transport system permease subunit
MPYALLLPALAVIVAVLGYPLYQLVALSFQKYGLFELIAHKGEWIGRSSTTASSGSCSPAPSASPR